MRPASFVLGLALLSLTAVAGPPGRGPAPGPRGNPHQVEIPGEDAVQDLRHSLERLRSLSRQLRNPDLAEQIRVEIAVAERDLARLDRTRWDLVDTAAALEMELLQCNRDRRPPPPPEPVIVVASPAEVAAIHRSVKDTAFSQEKLAVLQSGAADRWFTAAQVMGLLDAFDFEKDKVEAAVILHPHVVDPENWFQIYGAFDFDSNKRKVRERVGQ